MADKYASRAQLLGKVLGLERRAGRPLPAWHASPYDFDKFDLDKIGTGQGAASYGHGIYAAESPAVSGPLGAYDREFTSKRLRDAGYMGDMNDPIVRDMMAGLRKGMSDEELGRVYDPAYGRSEDDYALALMNARTLRENAAKLYELKLHAAPEDFLDQNAMLREQSPALLEKLQSIGVKTTHTIPTFKGGKSIEEAFPPSNQTAHTFNRRLVDAFRANSGDLERALNDVQNGLSPMDTAIPLPPLHVVEQWGRRRPQYEDAYSGPAQVPSSRRGLDVYRDLVNADEPYSPSKASAALKDAGIPGMRYLDGGSRSAGSGTRNYVIFDPEIIEIAKKYGLVPAAVGAGAMLGDDNEPEPYADGGRVGALSDVAKAAIKLFGKTYDRRETGYLLPDGTRLDLSGRHAAGYDRVGDRFVPPQGQRDYFTGTRNTDHRELGDLVGATEHPWLGVEKFMGDTGAVRYMPEQGVSIIDGQPVTDRQLQVIIGDFRASKEPLTFDVDPLGGATKARSQTFDRPTLEQLRAFLSGGGDE